MKALKIKSRTGTPIMVVDIPANEEHPISTGRGIKDRRHVEFYDTRFGTTITGQFITSYLAESLMVATRPALAGLILEDGARDWQISAEVFKDVQRWLADENA